MLHRIPHMTSSVTDSRAVAATLMTATERRASAWLASILALRMLGLFLVLPVFALEAGKYPGGDDTVMLGLAMGIYGLTQGLLQLPFGMASDRFGRKRVIVLGLLIFAAGSFVAAAAPTLQGLLIGRSLQGAGAVSAAVTALLADLTRDEVRTKAIAPVGASIGLMFAMSLVLAPILVDVVGFSGLFTLTGLLALTGMTVVLWRVPPEPAQHKHQPRGGLSEVLLRAGLMRLYLGVFVLHAVQLAMWVAVPALLVQSGLPKAHHWWVYLPAVLTSFFVMGGTLFPLQRRGYLRAVYLSALGLIALVQVGFLIQALGTTSWVSLSALLFVFFCGFHILEASQPSMTSRMAPAPVRGTAWGVYNTLQSLGCFAGGLGGGLLVKNYGTPALFLACAGAMLVWLLLAWPMKSAEYSAHKAP
jgi:MFS family permease